MGEDDMIGMWYWFEELEEEEEKTERKQSHPVEVIKDTVLHACMLYSRAFRSFAIPSSTFVW